MGEPPPPMGPRLRRDSMGGNDLLLHLVGWPIRGARGPKPTQPRRERTRKACLDGPQRRLLCRGEAEEAEHSSGETALVPLGSGVDLANRYFAVYSGVLPRANTG